MKESGKVPLPNKMYTKPVDVNQSHTFGHKPKLGISYEPLNATVDRFLGILPEYKEQLTGTPAAVAPPVA